jgi:chemotaxis protein CheZ
MSANHLSNADRRDTLTEACRHDLLAMHAAFESGDDAHFWSLVERLASRRESAVVPRLRRLTSDAQAALDRFRTEARLDALAEQDVPDARQRLDHVVRLTDEAAHKTLDFVERAGPLADHAARESAALATLWRELAERDQNLFDSRELIERMQRFLELTKNDAEQLRGNLSEVLMAQGYQDLAGQIIRPVTRLVSELEAVLDQLVRIANGEEVASRERLAPSPAALSAGLDEALRRGRGPSVPGVDAQDAVSARDDNDALLSGIGAR